MPSLLSFNTNTELAATDLVLTKPGTPVVGNTLFLLVGNDNANASTQFDARTGWNKQFEFGGPFPDCHLALFTRRYRGDEAATETVVGNTASDMWGVYGLLDEGGDEETALKVGTENIESSAASNVIAGIDTHPDSLSFYSLAFDGADANFSVSGAGWTEEAEIKSGTGADSASGTFGTKDTSDGATSGTATVSSTETDGSIGIQFSIRPFTQDEWMLVIALELDSVAGASAENWDAVSEEGSLRQLVQTAQENVGMALFTPAGKHARNHVVARVLLELGTSGGSEREKEINAPSAGAINTAIIDTEDHFKAVADAEAALL